MSNVTIAEGVTVTVDDDGSVTWNGAIIGRVWKGSRTYSPPLYKGSRVAKYHKQVPCWHAETPDHWGRPYNEDTRKRAIEQLIRRKERDDPA